MKGNVNGGRAVIGIVINSRPLRRAARSIGHFAQRLLVEKSLVERLFVKSLPIKSSLVERDGAQPRKNVTHGV